MGKARGCHSRLLSGTRCAVIRAPYLPAPTRPALSLSDPALLPGSGQGAPALGYLATDLT